METGERTGSPDLTHLDRLERAPWEHHLFHAIRVIEAAQPDKPGLGVSGRPAQDPVRLGQAPSLAFPPSMVSDFSRGKPGVAARLRNRVFGFFGPQGPLPLHLTEYARDRQRNLRDGTFVAFADMLTHRLAGLLYRAWLAGQPAASFDVPARDEFGRRIDALSGRGGEALRERDAFGDLSKRHFAGHLSAGVKSAERLQAVLSAVLDAPVHLREFVGTWLSLEPEDRWALGQAPTLGRGTVLGRAVWSRAAKFRIQVGPMSLAQYTDLLPGGRSLRTLDAAVRNMIGDQLDWDVNLVLESGEVRRLALDGTRALGHTTWIGTRKGRGDADDLLLVPAASRAHSEGRPLP